MKSRDTNCGKIYSRPLVHPSREDALHDAVDEDDDEGEEGEESRGIFGLMDAAGGLLHERERERDGRREKEREEEKESER